MTKETKALTVKEDPKELMTLSGTGIDFEADAEEFGANYSQEQMTTPFLNILQALSPQVTRGKAEFIKEASAGMFYNSVTKELYDGEKGLDIILSTFKESYIEWVPRNKGGGFVAEYGVVEGSKIRVEMDKDFNSIIKEGSPYGTPGNLLSLTHTRLGAIVSPDLSSWTPVVLSMSASGIKVSRNLNARHKLMEWINPLTGQPGMPGKCPMPLILWHVNAITRSNDSGSWFTWNFEKKAFLYELDQAKFLNLYRSIRDFSTSSRGKHVMDEAVKNAVKVDDSKDLNDSIPF